LERPTGVICEDPPVHAAVGGTSALDTSLGERVADALRGWFNPATILWTTGDALSITAPGVPVAALDADALVVRLFAQEGHSLVRLARLFVDDRNAAEDLVQEAFIRLARNAHRIEDPARAPAYLRSIVLNLARDHNRRGLMSLRHHEPADVEVATLEDELVLREDQRRVIRALQELPRRQRDCIVLRYHYEAGVAEIADTLDISPNSVKTHLKRGLAALERLLEEEP
jgi:RNA polymerase sigma factor (sigma-70 family)